ncbi:hypothetical protein PRK78_007002 [Emydomyces testavorans]|uniref:U4/U6.U5 small nuclear ribonucleoprotein 27kDa protein domain-containing protein n=1 Tax=Emydomyces testavorans TaxID=2070801 RepID=A0AAF0IMB8_9EURO|nr:hypothetical protein PRK78_007002 [Emydomyces testavorans]
MAEPPAKRARRMDSSTMWDMSERHSKLVDHPSDEIDAAGRRDKADTRRTTTSSRIEKRQRSRSRDREDRRRDRSRSRDKRAKDGPRDSRRDGVRDRERSRSRDRSREREYGRRDYYSKPTRHRGRPRTRSRSRSRSPAQNGAKLRTRSPPRGRRSDRKDAGRRSVPPDDNKGPNGLSDRKGHSSRPPRDVEGMDLDADMEVEDMENLMVKTMGFKCFRSTQNTKVPGNQIYGVRKEKKTQYRQYMNRMGGFNRPLSPTR